MRQLVFVFILIAFAITIFAVIGYFVLSIPPKNEVVVQKIDVDRVPHITPITQEPVIKPPSSKVCYQNEKYSVTAHKMVPLKGITSFTIDYHLGAQSLEIEEIAAYCLGLENNFLILDAGTGPGSRGLIVYDLDKRTKIFRGTYSSETDPIIIKNSITYWEQTDDIATEKNCPDFALYSSYGHSSVIEAHVKLDLITIEKVWLNEHRCSNRQ